MVKWNENLGKWRKEHGYTTKDWNEYADARTDQTNIFSACIGILTFALGYFLGGM